jgi:hypothetical protein
MVACRRRTRQVLTPDLLNATVTPSGPSVGAAAPEDKDWDNDGFYGWSIANRLCIGAGDGNDESHLMIDSIV